MMDEFCTPQEAAALLGVSRQSVYSLAQRYSWKTAKVGPARLFRRADVLATPRDVSARRSESQQKRRKAEPSISTDMPAPAPAQPIKPRPPGAKPKLGPAPRRGRRRGA